VQRVTGPPSKHYHIHPCQTRVCAVAGGCFKASNPMLKKIFGNLWVQLFIALWVGGNLLLTPLHFVGFLLPFAAVAAWRCRDVFQGSGVSAANVPLAPGESGLIIQVLGGTLNAPNWLIHQTQEWERSGGRKLVGRKMFYSKTSPHLYALYYEHLCYAAMIERYNRGLPVIDRAGNVIPLEFHSSGYPIVETVEEDGGRSLIIAVDFTTAGYDRYSHDQDRAIAVTKASKGKIHAQERTGVQAAEYNDAVQLMARLKRFGLYPIYTQASEYFKAPDGALVPTEPIMKEIVIAPPANDDIMSHGSAKFGNLG